MVPLTSAEGLAGVVFLVLLATTVVGALIATNAQRLIRAVSGLALCFIGVAGLYYYLNSPFVALMEILIYVGAVCVTIVFGVMLAEPRQEDLRPPRFALGKTVGFIAGGLIFWGIAGVGTKTSWYVSPTKMNEGSVEDLGRALLTNYSMVFELISLVLLVAILGALVIARSGRGTYKA